MIFTHRSGIITTVLISCMVCLTSAEVDSGTADFYVAINGRDSWSGRLSEPAEDGSDGPFATLARARDAVRAIKSGGNKNLRVLIRGGRYVLRQSVVFTLDDSANDHQTIEYCAYPGEHPVFSAAASITEWRKVSAPGVPENARNKIWCADTTQLRALKKGGDKRVLTLYDGGERLPRARGDGFRPSLKISREERHTANLRHLHFPQNALPALQHANDAELVVIPAYYWIMNILPVEELRFDENLVVTRHPATYPLTQNGMLGHDSVWLENALEVLDKPGEWVFNSSEQRIYLWPRTAKPGDQITVPLLSELIRVEGGINYEQAEDQPVEGLIFRGLHFTQGERVAWRGATGRGVQHDWEMFDAPTALVRLRGAQRCAVEDCVFSDSGHTAIRLDLHCIRNRIQRNTIARMGGVGILLAGYGPGTKDVNRENIIRNNYIHHIGEIYWGSVGIFAWQSGGNLIENNHIHHTPYSGIVISGRIIWDPQGVRECSRTIRWKEIGVDPHGLVPRLNWHEREKFLHGRRNIVRRNDIHNIMRKLGDGNCIYVSGTGGDNLISENYCHDSCGRYMNAAIRCDDDQHNTIIERNVIQRNMGFGEGIISKGDNDIINNVIFDINPSARHRALLVFPYGDISGTTIRKNIFYNRSPDVIPYYTGKSRRANEKKPSLENTHTDFNLYFHERDPHWLDEHFKNNRARQIDTHSLFADPLFRDPDKGDFTFSSGSPALKLGITPIDITLTGLEKEIRTQRLGRIITTRITPISGHIIQPLDITITSSAKNADIRYTLDGCEPSLDSATYTGTITLTNSALLRARSFAEGAQDLIGAVAWYTAPAPPINDDFETTAVGQPATGAESHVEHKTFSISVSNEKAASGERSLKFIDGPGQIHAFNPHLVYRSDLKDVTVSGSFDLWINQNTTLSYQWREYDRGYKTGPALQIDKNGELSCNKQRLLQLPLREWIGLKVTAFVGTGSDGKFELEIKLPGENKPHTFKNLSFDRSLEKLNWVGFIANGRESTHFYVDNIKILELRDIETD